jgi:hypothetical protein
VFEFIFQSTPRLRKKKPNYPDSCEEKVKIGNEGDTWMLTNGKHDTLGTEEDERRERSNVERGCMAVKERNDSE